MEGIVRDAFRTAFERVQTEVAVMPLNRWNESVFRYCFCRSVATAHPEVEQLVECDRIDLVLSRGNVRAFIEFKFYMRRQRFHPYDGRAPGFKGGPGRKNLSEFQACIDRLHQRAYAPSLSKYVVLVYADPKDGGRSKSRFSQHYDAYRHPRLDVAVLELAPSEAFKTSEDVVQGRLFQIKAPNGRSRRSPRLLGTAAFAGQPGVRRLSVRGGR